MEICPKIILKSKHLTNYKLFRIEQRQCSIGRYKERRGDSNLKQRIQKQMSISNEEKNSKNSQSHSTLPYLQRHEKPTNDLERHNSKERKSKRRLKKSHSKGRNTLSHKTSKNFYKKKHETGPLNLTKQQSAELRYQKVTKTRMVPGFKNMVAACPHDFLPSAYNNVIRGSDSILSPSTRLKKVDERIDHSLQANVKEFYATSNGLYYKEAVDEKGKLCLQ